MAEYKVKFEVFEGPLDLLLYLIKKEEVDIYEVNLTRLAEQFIEYIETMRLLYLKSRELLPVEQRAEVEGEDDSDDPRWELIRQLVEYKKFKDAACQLQTLEARQADVFARVPGKLEFERDAAPPKPDVSIFDLVNAVNVVLKRFNKREDLRDIFEDKWTVSEKIESLIRMIGERSTLKFSELFAGVTSRTEVVVTFLALLELIRLKQLTALQREPFAEIEICRAELDLATATTTPASGAQVESSDTQSLST